MSALRGGGSSPHGIGALRRFALVTNPRIPIYLTALKCLSLGEVGVAGAGHSYLKRDLLEPGHIARVAARALPSGHLRPPLLYWADKINQIVAFHQKVRQVIPPARNSPVHSHRLFGRIATFCRFPCSVATHSIMTILLGKDVLREDVRLRH